MLINFFPRRKRKYKKVFIKISIATVKTRTRVLCARNTRYFNIVFRSPAVRKEKDAKNPVGDFGQWRPLKETWSRHKGA